MQILEDYNARNKETGNYIAQVVENIFFLPNYVKSACGLVTKKLKFCSLAKEIKSSKLFFSISELKFQLFQLIIQTKTDFLSGK